MKKLAVLVLVMMLRVWFTQPFSAKRNGIVLGYVGNSLIYAVVRTDDGKIHSVYLGLICNSKWEEDQTYINEQKIFRCVWYLNYNGGGGYEDAN